MIRLSPQALSDLRDLLKHYETRNRPVAAENLLKALEDARRRIAANPQSGLPAPRAYPKLTVLGLNWLKSGRYWLAYSPTAPPVIAGIFDDTSDIPNRIRPEPQSE